MDDFISVWHMVSYTGSLSLEVSILMLIGFLQSTLALEYELSVFFCRNLFEQPKIYKFTGVFLDFYLKSRFSQNHLEVN